MKIANVGDLHIGGSRRATYERVLMGIADEAERRGAEVFNVPGDWHDTSSDENDRLFDRRLVERVTSYATLVVGRGNHDVPKDLLILDSFARAYPVHVFDEPGVVTLLGSTELQVACFADLHATYLKARLEQMPKGGTSIDVARAVLDELAAKMTGHGPRLFVGHLTLGGARMDNDQPARAAEFALALADLARVRADAYVLGHIHLRQSWTLNGAPVFYTGSPYSTNYGELAPKSWTMLHWTGKCFDVEIIPSPAPRLVCLVGTWKRDGESAEMTLSYDDAHNTDEPVSLAALGDAEVRLRYTVPTDDKASAKRAAETHQATLLGLGSLACALDPRPATNTRSRAPALGQSKSLPDKVDAFWRATDTWPEADRRTRIHEIIARHMQAVPPPPPVSLVRLERIEWRGLGNLVEHGQLSEGRAGLQVVVGPNRAGKSTLLSLFTAGVWGEGSKGSLDSLSRGKGARLTIQATTAHGTWKIDHEVDKKTVTVWEDDKPIVAGRRPYSRWVKEHLPSLDVLEQTSFLPPEGKGLLGVVDRPLKAALLTLSGATVFDAVHELVAEERREVAVRMKTLAAAISRAGNPTVDLANARQALVDAQGRIAALREEQAAITAHMERAGALHAARAEHDKTKSRVEDLTRRQADVETMLEKAAAAEETRAAFAHAQSERVRLSSLVERLLVEETALAREVADLREQIARAQSRASVENNRAERLAQRLTERAECEAAARDLPAAVEHLARAEAAATSAIEAHAKGDMRETVRAIRVRASDARLHPSYVSMEKGLVQIRDMADDALAASTEGTSLSRALSERTQATRQHSALERLASRLPSFEEDEADHALAVATAEEEEGMVALLGWRRQEVQGQLDTVRRSKETALQEGKRWAEEEKRLARDIPSSDLSHAQGMLVSLEEQLAEAVMEQATQAAVVTARELSVTQGTRAPEWRWTTPTEERARAVVRLLEADVRTLAKSEAAISSHEAACEQLDMDRVDLELAEREHGDLTEALRVLCRDGIQAFEADEIGSEIADDVTDLLQRHGFPWVLRYESLRDDIEQARWMLTETDTGVTYEARHRGGGASGGQESILITTLATAACMAVARRGGGVPDAAMAIDELAGAVREDIVEPWLAMLRDGAERAGMKVVYLVPPNDRKLIEACDGRIEVRPSGVGSLVEPVVLVSKLS